ncbi:MAG: Sporulation initiation inhibitor protein soj [Pedosphaera sp.]|nr:Sporulation initiation inhibitor protein soj [Pedosphaera sp.]
MQAKQNSLPAAKVQPAASRENGAMTSGAWDEWETEPPADGTAAGEFEIHFEAPTAKKVVLVVEVSQWEKAPVKMTRNGGGTWHARVPLFAAGRHLYRFLVDGKWQSDPAGEELAINPVGTF